MTRTVRVNTTLDDDLLERIDAFASERREDRSTAIRNPEPAARAHGASAAPFSGQGAATRNDLAGRFIIRSRIAWF